MINVIKILKNVLVSLYSNPTTLKLPNGSPVYKLTSPCRLYNSLSVTRCCTGFWSSLHTCFFSYTMILSLAFDEFPLFHKGPCTEISIQMHFLICVTLVHMLATLDLQNFRLKMSQGLSFLCISTKWLNIIFKATRNMFCFKILF